MTYFVKTYGCQANIHDSQNIEGILRAVGMSKADDYKQADVIIINTCSVRQKSEDKVYGWGLKINSYNKKKGQKIFLVGCMVGSAKGARKRYPIDKLHKKVPWVDYFLAPHEESKIPEILVKNGMLDSHALNILDFHKILPSDSDAEWSYISISTGCDNFCTFCVVPYARGNEVHREKTSILNEIKLRTARGKKNFMLVGQNVNSWGLDAKAKFKLRARSSHKTLFAELLRSVHNIEGVEKISFISSNPFDFTSELIETLSLPKIDRYLHIAVQSGDDEILKKMNRRHTIEEFKELITKIKKQVPDMKFGTDIIVGFPGETEEQFMNTVKLFDGIDFEVVYIAMYSPREGTNAAKFMKDDVSLEEKKHRHAYLTKIWRGTLR